MASNDADDDSGADVAAEDPDGATETPLAGGSTPDIDDGPDDGDTPYGIGIASGLAAWLVGYLAFYLRYSGEIRGSAAETALNAMSGGDSVWAAVGWVFYNGHFVTTNVDVPVFGSSAMNFLRDGAVLPHLAAPVLLLLGGAVVGYAARTHGPGDAAVTGLLLVPGYLVLSTVGVFLFEVSGNGASVGPDPVTGILLAGLVYPAVFGAVGALLGDQL